MGTSEEPKSLVQAITRREISHVCVLSLTNYIIYLPSFLIWVKSGVILFRFTQRRMRPLTDEETKTFFEKLSKYIGENIRLLIDRPDGTYCFRYHRDRVFYVSEEIMKKAGNVARENLISFGTCFGKFTKSGKFRLHITALDFLAPYSKYKVWLKPSAEQQFLYGHHMMKSGLGRITENTPQYQGVVVYSMGDMPLGFGVTAKSTAECRHTDPMTIVCFHQADIGEYIRSEETLT